MGLEFTLLVLSKQTEVPRVCLVMELSAFMERERLNQATAMEPLSIQRVSAKQTEAHKEHQDTELLVFMERGLQILDMVMVVMALPLSQSPSLIMAMDITHNLTAMDTTLEVMERERLNQVMELDMVLLPHLSILMEAPARTTEPPKDFPLMDITSTMFTERGLLSQVMELV